jgi:hypothetical protein
LTPRLPDRCYNQSDTPFLRSKRSGKVYIYEGTLPKKPEPTTISNKSTAVNKEKPATTGHPLDGFSSKLPKVGASNLERMQKLELYGGGSQALTTNMSKVEHVIAGHTFTRSLAETLLEKVCSSNEKFQGITVRRGAILPSGRTRS